MGTEQICLTAGWWSIHSIGLVQWPTCLSILLGPTEHGSTVSSFSKDHVSGFPLHHPLEVYMHRSTATGACTFCFVYLLYFVFPSCSQTFIHFHNGMQLYYTGRIANHSHHWLPVKEHLEGEHIPSMNSILKCFVIARWLWRLFLSHPSWLSLHVASMCHRHRN